MSRFSTTLVSLIFGSECIKTLVGCVICLKRLITLTFESSQSFLLLRLMGVFGAIPTSTDYDTNVA